MLVRRRAKAVVTVLHFLELDLPLEVVPVLLLARARVQVLHLELVPVLRLGLQPVLLQMLVKVRPLAQL